MVQDQGTTNALFTDNIYAHADIAVCTSFQLHVCKQPEPWPHRSRVSVLHSTDIV